MCIARDTSKEHVTWLDMCLLDSLSFKWCDSRGDTIGDKDHVFSSINWGQKKTGLICRTVCSYWGFCTVWNIGWNHPCGNVTGISATLRELTCPRTSMVGRSISIVLFVADILVFGGVYHCEGQVVKNCDSLWARGFPTKNTGNFWSFGKWESAATNPNESHGGRCPDGRLDWVFANGRHKLAGWRIARIAAGEKSMPSDS